MSTRVPEGLTELRGSSERLGIAVASFRALLKNTLQDLDAEELPFKANKLLASVYWVMAYLWASLSELVATQDEDDSLREDAERIDALMQTLRTRITRRVEPTEGNADRHTYYGFRQWFEGIPTGDFVTATAEGLQVEENLTQSLLDAHCLLEAAEWLEFLEEKSGPRRDAGLSQEALRKLLLSVTQLLSSGLGRANHKTTVLFRQAVRSRAPNLDAFELLVKRLLHHDQELWMQAWMRSLKA